MNKQDAKLEEALREWIAFAKENDTPVQVKHLIIAGMLAVMSRSTKENNR